MPRFTTPPNRDEFFAAVWEMVKQIPPGRVCTYGRIAELVGAPAGMETAAFKAFGPRWTGGAMAGCPEDVPWWRVINAQGRISPRQGADRQRALLAAEDIEFDAKGRIDLAQYLWDIA